MTLTDIYLFIFLIAFIGVLIFTVSGIMALFKRQPSKDEWIRVLVFIIIAIVFFILFGMSL